MFTGITEAMGTIRDISRQGTNKTFNVESPISDQLKVDQSVMHNGVCLTVTAVEGNRHTVTAIDETLKKTNLGTLAPGDLVNLERSMQMGGLLDGHIVQGHCDETVKCTAIEEKEGSRLYYFTLSPEHAGLVVPRGSIAINGVSLTVAGITQATFYVAIIPYTYEHTNFKHLREGALVNIEYDILGKYLMRQIEVYKDAR